MKKRVIFDKVARREFKRFDPHVQEDFDGYVFLLEKHGRLVFPDARKISSNLFEVRVEHNGAYRGFYAYVKGDFIVMLHFFQKKTQKTPQRNIETAVTRAKSYE